MKKSLLNGFLKVVYGSALSFAITSLAQAQPVITSFSPQSGPVGSTVTIVGENFNVVANQNVVYFGDVAAPVQSVDGSTTLTVTVPYGADYQFMSVIDIEMGLVAFSTVPFGAIYTPWGDNVFRPKVELTNSTGSSDTRFVIMGDVNSDGKPDLMTANSDNTISVFANQITSTTSGAVFGSPVILGLSGGSVSSSMAIGDLDGDGLLDIVAVYPGTSAVVVYRNITSGSGNTPAFAAGNSFSTLSTPISVRIGDFDGDGRPDLVVASRAASNNVCVLRNLGLVLGSLTFAPFQTFSAGENPNAVVVGDLDHDGKADLAVSNGSSNTVSVFQNISSVGAISFTNAGTLVAGTTPGVSIGDFDGDTYLDLATVNSGSSNVSVFRNTSTLGAISFASKVDFSTGAGGAPVSLGFGDTDGDGGLDIMVANFGLNQVAQLHNVSTVGTLSFTLTTDISHGSIVNPYRVRVEDLNADGKPDFVVATNGTTNNIAVFLQRISQSLSITSASTLEAGSSLSVTVSRSVSATLGGSLAYSIAAGSGSATVDVSGNLTAINVGTVTLTAMAVGNTDYATSSASQLITISMSTPTLNITSANAMVVDQALTATVSSSIAGLNITFSVAAGSGSATVNPTTGLLTAISVGAITLTALSAADTNYHGATTSQLITISQATPTLTVISGNSIASGQVLQTMVVTDATYGRGGAFTYAVTAGSGSATVNPNTGLVTSVGSGTVTLIVTSAGDTNYHATSVSQEIGMLPSINFLFVPESGTIGSTVFIVGQNLNPSPFNNAVYFGATRAIVQSVQGSTTLTVTVPYGASYQYITVTNLATHLTSYSTRPFVVTYASSGLHDFAAKRDFPIGSATTLTKFAMGDLDSDGKVDVVVPNIADNTVNIMRNTSSGIGSLSFSTTTLATGASPRAAILADLNGDGQLDIVVGNYDDDNVYVFTNATFAVGSLSFTVTPIVLLTDSHPYTLAIGDFARDSRPSIAVANYNSGNISVFRNTSLGGVISFAPKLNIATGAQPSSVIVGDLDLDGYTDLAVSNAGDNTISIVRNTFTFGALSFSVEVNLPTGDAPAELALGDLDGDGRADLAVAIPPIGHVAVLRNVSAVGSISFTASQSLNLGSADAVSIADTNGDNKVELVVVGNSVNHASILDNNSVSGSIQFNTVANYGTGVSPYTVGMGDLDLDGKLDIVTLNASTLSVLRNLDLPAAPQITSFSPESGAVSTTVTIVGQNFDPIASNNMVFFGAVRAAVQSAASTTLTVTVPYGANYEYISVTDLNTNLVGYSAKPYGVTYATPAGMYSSFAPRIDMPVASNSTLSIMDSGDLDNDGKIDIVIADINANAVSIYKNTSSVGSLSFTKVISLPTGSGPRSVAVGDLDGNGFKGIIVGNNGDNTISVFANTTAAVGSLSFSGAVVVPTGVGPLGINFVDFDLDGRPDVATVNSGGNSVSVFRNISTVDNLGFAARFDVSTGLYPFELAIGDLDLDGYPDMVTSDYGSNIVSVLHNISTPGSLSFTLASSLATGATPVSVAIADLDYDGKPDIVSANYTPGTLSVFHNTSSGAGNVTFASADTYAVGQGNGVTIGDVNGDGKADVLMAFHMANKIAVLPNNSVSGTISLGSKMNFGSGTNPFSMAIDDFDLDGKLDLATINLASVSLFRNIFISVAPAITSFSPQSGPISTSVTISGQNFDTTPSNNLVFFGATQAAVTGGTSNTLTVTVPYGASYQYISVTNLNTSLTARVSAPN